MIRAGISLGGHSDLYVFHGGTLTSVSFWNEILDPNVRPYAEGRGSRVVKVSDRGWPCPELEPSTTKDPLCRAAMHVKSVESRNVLPWCGVVVRRGGCQFMCRPRHLTMVQNYVVRRQKPSCR
ncbi:uncharacterized protein TNCV_1402191 [Trichonephila clavipes]|nr:uncharacterized protein TNCV_1402191 [Trichonephila clavipes]